MTESAGNPVAGILFEKYDIVGGCAFGVYKADDVAEIEKLDALVEAKLIFSITEAEHTSCLKKKRPGFIEPSHSNQDLPGVPIKGQVVAVVVDGSVDEIEAQVAIKTIGTVEDALVVSAPPQPVTSDAPAPATDAPQPEVQTRRGKK